MKVILNDRNELFVGFKSTPGRPAHYTAHFAKPEPLKPIQAAVYDTNIEVDVALADLRKGGHDVTAAELILKGV